MKREIADWTEEDILNLIKNHLAESSTLEFKACDALRRIEKKDWRKEFAKDVSAFANSAGAIVIYGIIENRRTHEAETLDAGFDPVELNIETLEQIANSQIQRAVEGIKYKAIPLSGDKQGRFAYVLDIPESNRAPHMANHRFYKRYNFESVSMEEHEVRERYRRETFPGKDVVESWRDDAINPILDTLKSERRLLESQAWTWSHHENQFNGFRRLSNNSKFSPNEEDFVNRHSEIATLLREHDLTLARLNTVGGVLFDQLATSSFIREVFASAISEESLTKFISENPRFYQHTPETVVRDLFGADDQSSRQRKLDLFAEWAINNGAPTAASPDLFDFWRAFGEGFRSLVLCPPLSEYRNEVEDVRHNLLGVGHHLVTTLKEIRKTLSERHNIAQEAPRSSETYAYNPPGVWPRW